MTEEDKDLGGRPSHEPTEENKNLVLALAGYGASQKYIAAQIGIHDETLRIHYRKELDEAVEKANATVAQSLFKKAIGDGSQSGTCAMFWMKTRAGWKETNVTEHSGKDGEAIKYEDVGTARETLAALIEKHK